MATKLTPAQYRARANKLVERGNYFGSSKPVSKRVDNLIRSAADATHYKENELEKFRERLSGPKPPSPTSIGRVFGKLPLESVAEIAMAGHGISTNLNEQKSLLAQYGFSDPVQQVFLGSLASHPEGQINQKVPPLPVHYRFQPTEVRRTPLELFWDQGIDITPGPKDYASVFLTDRSSRHAMIRDLSAQFPGIVDYHTPTSAIFRGSTMLYFTVLDHLPDREPLYAGAFGALMASPLWKHFFSYNMAAVHDIDITLNHTELTPTILGNIESSFARTRAVGGPSFYSVQPELGVTFQTRIDMETLAEFVSNTNPEAVQAMSEETWRSIIERSMDIEIGLFIDPEASPSQVSEQSKNAFNAWAPYLVQWGAEMFLDSIHPSHIQSSDNYILSAPDHRHGAN